MDGINGAVKVRFRFAQTVNIAADNEREIVRAAGARAFLRGDKLAIKIEPRQYTS